MDDNQIRLVLDLLGVENIDRATEKLRQLRGSMQETYDLEAKVGQGFALASQQVDEALDREVASAVEATQARKMLAQALEEDAAAQRVLQTTTANTASRTGDMGRGFMLASQQAQDFVSVMSAGGGFDRALASTTNGVTGMAMAFGASGGVAGALTVVTVGVAAALPWLEKLTGATEDAGKAAKETADALAKLRGMQTGEEEQAAKAVQGVLKEGPARVVESGVRQSLAAANAPELQRLMSGLRDLENQPLNQGNVESNRQARVATQARIDALQQQAGAEGDRIMTDLGRGDPSAVASVLDMARRAPQDFPKGFPERLARTTPEARKATREQEAGADRDTALAEAERDRRAKAKKDAHDLQSRQADEQTAQAEGQYEARLAREKAKDKELKDRRQRLQHEQEIERQAIEQAEAEKDRAAAKAARDNDPDAVLRRERDRVHDETAAAVMQEWNRAGRVDAQGRPVSVDDVQRIIRDADRAREAPGVDLAGAIHQAMDARDQRWAAWATEQRARLMMMDGQMDGMTPMLPPQMRRAW